MERQRIIQRQKEKLIGQREKIDFALLMICIKEDHYSAIHSGHKHTDQAQVKMINFILARTFDRQRDSTRQLLENAFNKQRGGNVSDNSIEAVVPRITHYIKPEYQNGIGQSSQWTRNF
ncbi:MULTISPECIES: hypothetical protein [unclassified Sporolactobacillus]|uniref:hypothetical protein n=1 Tax=unclassified Sporolactobacillus TaxID=2628533 RepID=UPI0023688F04|nr:hypothetical protein [Sporolactobacillus sp. CQH2019]MDD9147917.1 hypothetical protein [Sporolactobacillus sp. CQH2019]